MALFRCVCTTIFILSNVIGILSKKGASLTFVIDDTASMQQDIDGVISGVGSIMDVIINSGYSQIEDMVLVTFNDPSVKFRVHTKDRQAMNRALNSIQVHGGWDCPEMALTGLKLALQKSGSGSYVFLFTDDTAKDYKLVERIKTLCQEKESHVVFVITPNKSCLEYNKDFTPYYAIATASAGQVLRLGDKIDVGKIIPYINATVTGDRSVITTQTAPPNQWASIPFEIDDQTEYAIASTSGDNVIFHLFNEHNVSIKEYQVVVWIDNVKVIKISKPGHYVARVNSHSMTSVVIFGRTDFTFEPGFSFNPINVFNDTIKQPYAGIETYLGISVNEPKHLIDITSVEIYDMDQNLIKELPLKEIYGDVYTTAQFLPPSTLFKVAVKGTIRSTGAVIKRFAALPIETITSKNGRPLIINGNTHYYGVKGDIVLRIPCLAIADPKPVIDWFVNGKIIIEDKNFLIEDGTLIIKNVVEKASNTYVCQAKNTLGQDRKNYTVDITSTVEIIEGKILYILKNTNARLNCSMNTTENDSVRWFKNGEFISDGPHIDIEDATLINNGKYTCRVSNSLSSNNGETIKVLVDAPPTHNTNKKSPRYKNWEDGQNIITCEVTTYDTENLEIQWLHNGNVMKNEHRFELKFPTWGNYTCLVKNHFGEVKDEIHVKSDDCLIDMTSRIISHLPLILAENSTLPIFIKKNNLIIIPSQTHFKMSCDSFRKFPEKKEIDVICSKEDTYLVDGMTERFSDLYCTNENKPKKLVTGTSCAGEKTMAIKVGFEVSTFINVYEICYETEQSKPVYTKIDIPNPKFKKYDADITTDKKYIYMPFSKSTAETKKYKIRGTDCNYVKGSLVDAEDIEFGVPQTSAFELLEFHEILYSSCSNESSWEIVKKIIQNSIAGNYDDSKYTIWSGASRWENKDGLLVPRYLWKVVKKSNSVESLAFVSVNDPQNEDSDRLCGAENKCDDFGSNMDELKWPIYCCEVPEFSKAFNISETVFAY